MQHVIHLSVHQVWNKKETIAGIVLIIVYAEVPVYILYLWVLYTYVYMQEMKTVLKCYAVHWSIAINKLPLLLYNYKHATWQLRMAISDDVGIWWKNWIKTKKLS